MAEPEKDKAQLLRVDNGGSDPNLGDTLLPMLIGGLILIVVAMILVMIFV